MRRREPDPTPARDRSRAQSAGERAVDQADLARDSKKDGTMCAASICTITDGLTKREQTGPYGGNHWCEKHDPEGGDR